MSQEKEGSERRVDLLQRVLQSLRIFESLAGLRFLRSRLGNQPAWESTNGTSVPQTLINCDAIDPRSKGGGPLKTAQPSEDPHENLLRQISRLLSADKSNREAVDLARKQLVKRTLSDAVPFSTARKDCIESTWERITLHAIH
jgi:hypothetical protein